MQCAVKRGVQQALQDTKNASQAFVGLSQFPPHNSPPFKNTPLNQTVYLIIGGQILAGAPSSAATENIETALKGTASGFLTGVPFPVVRGDPLNEFDASVWMPVVQVTTGVYERKHVSGFDFMVSSFDALVALAFTIQINGLTVVDRASLNDLNDLSLEVPPMGNLVVYAANRNAFSAFLVKLSMKGWVYTCTGMGNYLDQALYTDTLDDDPPLDSCAPSDDTWISGLAGTTNRSGGCN
jgi:hypothetical protein